MAQASPPEESGWKLPSVPMAGLPAAPSCQSSLPLFGHQKGEYMAPHGTMSMANDGGWCSLQFAQQFRYLPMVPSVSVSEPPAHGTVRAEDMKDRVAVAYQPAPGFVGTDHFEIRTDGPLPHHIPVAVTVRSSEAG
jgi:hypothetical protein